MKFLKDVVFAKHLAKKSVEVDEIGLAVHEPRRPAVEGHETGAAHVHLRVARLADPSLGDPLLHLVRNSIDHGIELPAERRRLGKPETGTIRLEASHSGNNVFIRFGVPSGRVHTKTSPAA